VARQPFKSLFCEFFQCPPADYEEQVFRKCLYFHARLAAPLIRTLSPAFFEEDFKLIQYLSAATNWRELNAEMVSFQDKNRYEGKFLRKTLKIRVSGRKAAALAQRLFAVSHRNAHGNGDKKQVNPAREAGSTDGQNT
jgi:hypothetical protein